MKRFAVLLLTLAMAFCCAAPAFAAGTIEVTEDVSVSDDYDWTRFQGQNLTLNVYNWGEYISNGSDDSVMWWPPSRSLPASRSTTPPLIPTSPCTPN